MSVFVCVHIVQFIKHVWKEALSWTHFLPSASTTLSQQTPLGHLSPSHTHTDTHKQQQQQQRSPWNGQSSQVSTSVSTCSHQWQNRWPSVAGAELYFGCEVQRSWDVSWPKLSWLHEWLCQWTWKYLFGSINHWEKPMGMDDGCRMKASKNISSQSIC